MESATCAQHPLTGRGVLRPLADIGRTQGTCSVHWCANCGPLPVLLVGRHPYTSGECACSARLWVGKRVGRVWASGAVRFDLLLGFLVLFIMPCVARVSAKRQVAVAGCRRCERQRGDAPQVTKTKRKPRGAGAGSRMWPMRTRDSAATRNPKGQGVPEKAQVTDTTQARAYAAPD